MFKIVAMRLLLLIFFLAIVFISRGQELYVFSEPASNMAAKSVGLRLNNYFAKENVSGKSNYYFQPELMWGVSKKTMLHGELFFSNKDAGFAADGGSLYLKYRFYSRDEVHSHFRMAAFAKWAYNTGKINQPAIDLAGYNSGIETGIVTTKLINKIALSAAASFVHATGNNNFYYPAKNRNAVSYNFSLGKLLLPKEYVSYDQVNLNGMIEFLGQTNLYTGKSYLDIASSVQFIFFSRMRLDIGYRFAVVKELSRQAIDSYLLRVEYSFFNVFK